MSKKEPKASLEDMMEDLQRAGQEQQSSTQEAKLVTREDGTKMMKVRKRKRRTDQPRKEEFKRRRRNRFLWATAGVFLIFLTVLGCVVGMAYYNSKSYHAKVKETIAVSSGADVELGLLSIRPDNAAVNEVGMSWPEGRGMIEFLKLKQIQVNYPVQSLLRDVWKGSSVQAAEGVLSLRGAKDYSFGGSNQSEVDYDFNYYRCSDLDVHFGSVRKVPAVEGTDVTLKLHDAGRPQLSMSGGTLNYALFEDLEIENGWLSFGDRAADAILRLQGAKGNGYISLEGKMPYASDEGIPMVAELERFPIVRMLPDGAKRFFDGWVDSEEVTMVIDPSDPEALQAEGKFDAKVFRIRDFQFLAELSLLVGQEWYENPKFTNVASGRFKRVGKALELNDLVLEESSYLKLVGNVVIEETGEISGKLEMGLPVASLSMLRDKAPPGMFSSPREGFVWTDINLGGTIVSASDDLAPRLSALKSTMNILPKSATEPEQEDENSSDGASFEELTE